MDVPPGYVYDSGVDRPYPLHQARTTPMPSQRAGTITPSHASSNPPQRAGTITPSHASSNPPMPSQRAGTITPSHVSSNPPMPSQRVGTITPSHASRGVTASLDFLPSPRTLQGNSLQPCHRPPQAQSELDSEAGGGGCASGSGLETDSNASTLKALALSEKLNTTVEGDVIEKTRNLLTLNEETSQNFTTRVAACLSQFRDSSLGSESSPLTNTVFPVVQDEKAPSPCSQPSLSRSGSGLSLDLQLSSTGSGYAATGSSSSIDTFTAPQPSSTAATADGVGGFSTAADAQPRVGGGGNDGASTGPRIGDDVAMDMMVLAPPHEHGHVHDQRVSYQHDLHITEHKRTYNSFHRHQMIPVAPYLEHFPPGTSHTHSYEGPMSPLHEVSWKARLREGSHSFPRHMELSRSSLADYSPENITIDV